MTKLTDIRDALIDRIGMDWDQDMAAEGALIDIQHILRELVAYLIERDGEPS